MSSGVPKPVSPSYKPRAEVSPLRSSRAMKEREMRHHDMHHEPCGWGWGWLGSLLLFFIALTVFVYLIIYSTQPGWVKDSSTGDVDLGKVLVASVIIAIVVIIIVWVIWAIVRSGQCY